MGSIDNNSNKKKSNKGKHIKEEANLNDIKQVKSKSRKEKHLSNFTRFLFIIIMLAIVISLTMLGIYYFKPESIDTITNSREIGKYNSELINKSNSAKESSVIVGGNKSSEKFINKVYKKKEYNIATGFFEREYDIIYFSYLDDMKKAEKMSKDLILTYDEYVAYCKSNNIKQKFTDSSKRYSIFSNFNEGYEDINVFVCDRKVEGDTEIMYLSKEYLNPNPDSIAGFVLIFPSSQPGTTKTTLREVISESDYAYLTGEKIKITNSQIDKDVLYLKNITITDNEKVNYVLNKMLENICHKDLISYSYSYEIPTPEIVEAKLDLNSCTQYTTKNNKVKYTVYGDYEAVDFNDKGYDGNNWFYKDEIIKKFLNAESLSYQDFFDFKLDENDDYYIVKAYVTKQNNVLEEKVSREEEFFYIDKETFELREMYCHNFISQYTLVFNYSNETINIPEDIL